MKKVTRIFALMMVQLLAGCAIKTEIPSCTVPAQTPTTGQEQINKTLEPTLSEENIVAVPTSTAKINMTVPEITENPTPEPTATPVPFATRMPSPRDTDFVLLTDYVPDCVIDLRYATEHNFTGKKIYEFNEPWLRYGTVKKLMAVQKELDAYGLYLKLWDGFRPTEAQFRLWDVCPDATYVADPTKGFSSHSRGNTVDVTLVDRAGNEVTMPTDFDDFSTLADRDYSDCAPEAAKNALLLEDIMQKHGFKPYHGEWWHFSDEEQYAVEEAFRPVAMKEYYARCEEYISLRLAPDLSSGVLQHIGVGERFMVAAEQDGFALVFYGDMQGYVLKKYIAPVE